MTSIPAAPRSQGGGDVPREEQPRPGGGEGTNNKDFKVGGDPFLIITGEKDGALDQNLLDRY